MTEQQNLATRQRETNTSSHEWSRQPVPLRRLGRRQTSCRSSTRLQRSPRGRSRKIADLIKSGLAERRKKPTMTEGEKTRERPREINSSFTRTVEQTTSSFTTSRLSADELQPTTPSPAVPKKAVEEPSRSDQKRPRIAAKEDEETAPTMFAETQRAPAMVARPQVAPASVL